MRSRLRLCFTALLFVFAPALVPLSVRAEERPRETARYVVYLLGQRVGSMVSRTFDVTYENKPAVRSEADMTMKLQTLGSAVEQRLVMTNLTDRRGRPMWIETVLSSMGRKTRYQARFEPAQVVCDVDAGGQKSTTRVPIPRGVTLIADPDNSAAGAELRVGKKESRHFFEILSMTIQRLDSEVVRTEQRKVHGKPVLTYVLRTRNSAEAGTGETRVDARGRMLEEKDPRGLRVVREDLDEVAAPESVARVDFAEATAVTTAVKLPNPRSTDRLRLRVAGIPAADLILSDERQQVVSRAGSGEALTATYLIRSRALPDTSMPPAAGSDDPSLRDAPYLGSTDPAIQRQAKELAAGAADRVTIARRIRSWVRAHMVKLNNVGTPRSAPEIMRSRDGVCRDYATLFCALARAAGVPARLCSGMEYFRDAFYYHAWVECRLTDDAGGWYPFDATLDQDSVDATHVKFAQGDPAMMFRTTRVVGRIQAEIVDSHERITSSGGN